MHIAIATVIDAARGRFATKAPAGPMAPAAEPAQPQRRTTASAPPLENPLIPSTYAHFVRSPLVGETSPTTADLMVAVHRSAIVQRSAAEYKLTLERLMDVASYRAVIARAIGFAREKDLGLSPEVIAEIIDGMSASLDEEIGAAVANKANHDLAEKSAMARHSPLKAVVSKRLNEFVTERASLLQADDAERRANQMGLTGSSRYGELRKVGLSDSEIAQILPGASTPETVVADRNERVAELGRQIENLLSFSNSATFDASPIVGIDPAIDAAILARDGALPVEAA